MPRKIWGAFFLNASGQCTSHGSVSSNAFDTARDEASGHRSTSPAPQALRLRLPPTAACSLWKSCLFFRLRKGRNEDLTLGTTGAAQLSVNRHQGTIEHLGQRHVPSVVTGQVVPQCPYAVGKRREGKQLQVKPQQIPVCAVRLKPGRFCRLVPTGAGCCSLRPTPVPDRPKSPQRRRTPPISLPAPSRPGPRQARTRRRLPSRPVRITGA